MFNLSGAWYWPINKELNPLFNFKLFGDLFDNLMYLILLIYIISEVLKKRINLYCNLLVLLMFSLIALSVIFSDDLIVSIKSFIRLTLIYFFAISINRYFDERRLIDIIVSFFIFLVLFNFIYLLIKPDIGFMGGLHAGSARGALNHKNGFGFLMSISFTLLIFSRNFSTIKIFSSIVAFLMVFMSSSSTAILLVLTSLLLYFYIYINKRLNMSAPVNIFIFIFIVISIVFFNLLSEKVLFILGKSKDLSSRSMLWDFYLNEIFRNLFFGIGSYNWGEKIKYSFELITGVPNFYTPHNSYISTQISYGIFVLSIYLFLILSSLINMLRGKVIYLMPVAACLPILFIRGWVESGISVSVNLYIFLMLIFWTNNNKKRKVFVKWS
jgi:hypothetical protein